MIKKNVKDFIGGTFKLVTKCDYDQEDKVTEMLDSLKKEFRGVFEVEFELDDKIHGRSLQTDTGWKMVLDRGLDIYKKSQDFQVQRERECKSFYVTYIKE